MSVDGDFRKPFNHRTTSSSVVLEVHDRDGSVCRETLVRGWDGVKWAKGDGDGFVERMRLAVFVGNDLVEETGVSTFEEYERWKETRGNGSGC